MNYGNDNTRNTMMAQLVPMVVEQTNLGERSYDIFSRLLKDRIIFINNEINDVMADLVIAQILFLDSQTQEREISVYINSPGGSVTAGLAIYDTMQYVRSTIQTICLGQACSMGALLLAGGTKGHRFSLPSARVMVHQPWGGVQGQATDVQIQAKEILRLKKLTTDILVSCTGQEFGTLQQDLERDFFMTPIEAKKYGLIDKLLGEESDGTN